MKITLKNWEEVRKKILESGIARVEYDSDEKLQMITTKNNERFEFSPEVFERFKNIGLLQRGIRTGKNS